MRSLLLGLVVVATLGCSTDEGPNDTPDTPLGRVVAEVADVQGWNEDEVLIYGLDGPLMPGQTVGPAFEVGGDDAEPFTIQKPTWFFWADLSPDQLFSHPTVFIYIDDEDGTLTVEDQNWFPTIDGLIYHPSEPVWGNPLPIDGTGSLSAPLRDRVGEPCGKPTALIIQGFDHPFIDNTVARLESVLNGRDYDVRRITRAEEPDPTKRPALVASALLELSQSERASQLDIFYLGHATENGRWAFGKDATAVTTMSAAVLVDSLRDPSTTRINIIIEACYSENFATSGPTPLGEYLAETSADDTLVQVFASSLSSQLSYLSPRERSAPFTERFLDAIEGLDPGELPDYGAVEQPRITLLGRNNRPFVQDPPPPAVIQPSVPILFVDAEYDECQVVADLGQDSYGRSVVIRGAGFGDAEGTVELFSWTRAASGDRLGSAVSVPIVSWSESALEVRVPMRSEGFGGDLSLLEPHLRDYLWNPDTRAYYFGRYFVQVTRADGVKSAELEPVPDGVPPEHFFAPQLVHISPQIQELNWTPDYTSRDSVEWNEMWHPVTPESEGLGTASVLVSDLRLFTDQKPYLLNFLGEPVVGNFPRVGPLESGNRPHNTGPRALGAGTWAYELPAAERDLATARNREFPEFNYWGFRQVFEPDWNLTSTWTFLLIYD